MNLSKLKGKIVEQGLSTKEISDKFGISIQAMNKKLSGKTKITTEDAVKFCSILSIDNASEKSDIFLV